MNNKVIKVLDEEHGKRVIEFFKQYCNTWGLKGNYVGGHYGIINGEFDRWTTYEVEKSNAEIIELPETVGKTMVGNGWMVEAKEEPKAEENANS